MEIYKLIHGHRSIRKYKSDPVPEATLERILTAATRASSSGNMQVYSVIVTSDPRIKKELLPLHFDQEMVTQAPLLLTFCADFRRMRHWLALRDAPDNFDNFMSFMIAAIDAVLASQNAALAAESERLGICYMGTTLASCLGISKVLKCPPGVVPVVGFSLGYPDENPPLRDRLPLSGLVHREVYQDPSPEEVIAVYKDREQKGWERYMAIDGLREMAHKAGAENLAQIYTKAKYTKESHEIYSANVLECLRMQGFFGAK